MPARRTGRLCLEHLLLGDLRCAGSAVLPMRSGVDVTRRVQGRCSVVALWMASIAAAVVAGCTESSITSNTTGPDTPGKCDITVSAPPGMGPEGGDATIRVTTQPECEWTASTGASWITGLTPASGQGPGSVTYRVAPNDTEDAREGEIAINGTKVRVSQRAPCVIDLAPATRSVAARGGPGSVTVATTADCTWTASADAGWIAIAQPAQGSGGGTVNFTVAANTGSARTAHILVGRARSTVTQESAASACAVSITPPSQNIGPAGGPGAPIAITAPNGCTWTASSAAPWITITSATSGSGSGSITFSAVTNNGAARTGTISIGSSTFKLTQAAAPACTYALHTTGMNALPGGDNGAVGVTAPNGCGWTASSNAGWITITQGASGSGNGSVSFTIAANTTGATRSGTLTVAGLTYTVTQASSGSGDGGGGGGGGGSGGGSCTYALSTNGMNALPGGDNGAVGVTAPNGCGWTASSNAGWITITQGAGGSGSGSVSFAIAANSTGSGRSGTLTVAGHTYTVTQLPVAPACSFVVSPPNHDLSGNPQTASFTVTTTSGCGWTAAANAPWIVITSGASGTGSGSVTFTVGQNDGPQRTDTMTIAGQSVSVLQRSRQ